MPRANRPQRRLQQTLPNQQETWSTVFEDETNTCTSGSEPLMAFPVLLADGISQLICDDLQGNGSGRIGVSWQRYYYSPTQLTGHGLPPFKGG